MNQLCLPNAIVLTATKNMMISYEFFLKKIVEPTRTTKRTKRFTDHILASFGKRVIQSDQIYSNTRVSTQVNTSQNESTRIKTSQHKSTRARNRSKRVRHKPTRVQYQSTRINTSSTRVKMSQRESIRPRNYHSFWSLVGEV